MPDKSSNWVLSSIKALLVVSFYLPPFYRRAFFYGERYLTCPSRITRICDCYLFPRPFASVSSIIVAKSTLSNCVIFDEKTRPRTFFHSLIRRKNANRVHRFLRKVTLNPYYIRVVVMCRALGRPLELSRMKNVTYGICM